MLLNSILELPCTENELPLTEYMYFGTSIVLQRLAIRSSKGTMTSVHPTDSTDAMRKS